MKKSTKIFVFGGLICMAVGMVIMLITGGIGGVRIVKEFGDVLRDASITKDNLGLEIDLPDEFVGLEFSNFAGTKELSVSENQITSVYISIDGGEVNIEDGNSDAVVLVTESGFNTKYSVENGVLVIKEENDGFSNGGVIDVYLPRDMIFDEITVNVGGGQMDAQELKAKEVDLNVGAGEANIESVVAEYMDANVGVGEIKIEHSEISGKATVNVGMGTMEFGGSVSGDLKIRCGMGDLEFDAEGVSYDTYNYRLRCAAGNIDLGDSSFSGVGMNKHIDNGSDKTIDIDCGMGNVSIDF